MKCKECGGTWVAVNLGCYNCYNDYEGSGCGSDGCPAWGIATETRCRCENPPADLPRQDMSPEGSDDENDDVVESGTCF